MAAAASRIGEFGKIFEDKKVLEKLTIFVTRWYAIMEQRTENRLSLSKVPDYEYCLSGGALEFKEGFINQSDGGEEPDGIRDALRDVINVIAPKYKENFYLKIGVREFFLYGGMKDGRFFFYQEKKSPLQVAIDSLVKKLALRSKGKLIVTTPGEQKEFTFEYDSSPIVAAVEGAGADEEINALKRVISDLYGVGEFTIKFDRFEIDETHRVGPTVVGVESDSLGGMLTDVQELVRCLKLNLKDLFTLLSSSPISEHLKSPVAIRMALIKFLLPTINALYTRAMTAEEIASTLTAVSKELNRRLVALDNVVEVLGKGHLPTEPDPRASVSETEPDLGLDKKIKVITRAIKFLKELFNKWQAAEKSLEVLLDEGKDRGKDNAQAGGKARKGAGKAETAENPVIQSLKRQLDNATKNIEIAERDLRAKIEHSELLAKSLEQARAQITQLTRATQDHGATLSELQAALFKIEVDRIALKQELVQSKQALQQSEEAHGRQIGELKDALAQAEQKVRQSEERMARAEAALAEERAAREKAETASPENLARVITELVGTVSGLQRAVEEQTTENARLRAALDNKYVPLGWLVRLPDGSLGPAYVLAQSLVDALNRAAEQQAAVATTSPSTPATVPPGPFFGGGAAVFYPGQQPLGCG